MKREKLLMEQKATLESLIAKTEFVYSEEFYKLDEFDKQKYLKDKMATETHLSTLCNLLWGAKVQLGGVADMFALGIISSMFSGSSFCSSTPSVDYLKKTLDSEEKENKEQIFEIPAE